jgi:hypothetical protein
LLKLAFIHRRDNDVGGFVHFSKRRFEMDGALLDQISGKQYELPVFENEMVGIESAGPCIRVTFKWMKGSWWEPRHPFPPSRDDLPKQGNWDWRVETTSEDETCAIFIRGDKEHRLILCCTDPTASPKPIEVTWQ